jgi:hypothetical protein
MTMTIESGWYFQSGIWEFGENRLRRVGPRCLSRRLPEDHTRVSEQRIPVPFHPCLLVAFVFPFQLECLAQC